MPIYDLAIKLEGLKAMVGGGIADDHLSSLLFPMEELADRRSLFSRLKSCDKPLLLEHKNLLTENFNLLINDRVLSANSAGQSRGILRAEDWDRPVHEFFGHLVVPIEDVRPEALDRAHAGILSALSRFADHRERNDALVVERYFDSEADQTRMPISAVPIDPAELPPARLRAGQRMTIRLQRPVNDGQSRGWLFYLRNPDTREAAVQKEYVWDQHLNELIFWHDGGSFELPPKVVGHLPGFPETTRDLTGAVTAFLIVEPDRSDAITRLITKVQPNWNGRAAPSFEAFAHLITCARRVFQKGNAKRQADGGLAYAPPKLFVRNYVVGSEA